MAVLNSRGRDSPESTCDNDPVVDRGCPEAGPGGGQGCGGLPAEAALQQQLGGGQVASVGEAACH